jgi:aminomethyltransferase
MMDGELQKTPLHDRHVALEARMGEADGWSMPMSYRGLADEVAAVRKSAGAIDLSHVSRLRLRGGGALNLLERVCTADVVHQEDNTSIPTCLCNERGGIVDVARVLRLDDEWWLIGSACNRAKLLDHLARQDVPSVKIDDQTARTVMLAVAGPAAGELLDRVLPVKVSHRPAGAVEAGSLLITKYVAARIDIGGQWGLAVILPAVLAGKAWDTVTRKPPAAAPVGLVAYGVLEMEAGVPRYGWEINETIDPYTAALAGTVDESRMFLGSIPLRQIGGRALARVRAGLVLEISQAEVARAVELLAAGGGGTSPVGAGETSHVAQPPSAVSADEASHVAQPPSVVIPRQGSAVRRADGTECGTITSATYSPTLDRIIAMAYVAPDVAQAGTTLNVESPSGQATATVSELPFVK